MYLTSEKEENKLKNHQNIFVEAINQIFVFLKYNQTRRFQRYNYNDIIISLLHKCMFVDSDFQSCAQRFKQHCDF